MRFKQKQIASIVVTAFLLGACGSSSSLSMFQPSTVTYTDTKWCVPGRLKRVLNRLSRRFGTVTVTSTNRWWLENWAKGGARRSYHRGCRAVDFTVPGSPSKVVAFLKSQRGVGGYKYYPSGHYHIDVGPRRTW